MPAPFSGFAGIKKGLTHDTHIEAFKIQKDKQNYKEYIFSDKMMEKVHEVKNSAESEDALFQKFANSICPEIFGMEEVK